MTRLPAPMGLLIDRNRPLTFSFEGQSYQGYAGDTLASALLGEGRWLLSRSFKYHRPRGPLTLAGQDANTLVQLPDEPNVLADELPLREGLTARAQNVSGSLERDRDALLGKFSRFMPVGFYYRAFYKPKGMWKRWEPLIRKKAGLGVLDLTFVPTYHDKAYLFCDVAVIGAGPAGLAAALAAAQGGAEVLLVEQQPLLGGALAWGRFGLDAGQGEGLREELIAAVRAEPRIRVLEAAVCNGWFAEHYLPVIQDNRMFKVRARQTILASGAFDQPVIFRNNDLPGILLTSAAQRLMRLYGVRPGRRGVVLAGNDDGYLAALDLQEQGVAVAALLDLRTAPRDAQLLQAVSERGIPVHLGHTVYEAHADADGRQLARVDVRPIVGQGQVGPAGLTLDCDLLCMSAGYMPVYQLACQAGGTLGYLDDQAAFSLGNLPRGLHLAGSVNGRHALERVLADGRAAAARALTELDLAPLASEQTQADDSQVNFPWPMFAHPQGKEFVDFDEDLQIADIVNATRHGYRDVQLVKRFSTVGMGPSQGRHSALPTARLVAAATARSVSDTGVTTARPPFTAEKLAHVAGRAFDPYRRTAMHRRHLELGASLMPAGVWQRPAFYGPASERQRCIQAEVRQVREGVGLIDVSTLGGLDVRGPDAAELLERVYTFGFRKLPVGRTRYALMTAEDGVVIDDGVAARLGDEHFYVSATTSGVDRVYRSLLKWNAQWRLDVDIANVSAAFAAVNLAGPRSREVLRELCPELDLTSEAFPYLAVREGRVAGIPARLLRVGFVGELGYEIHVPARFGERLWDALMEAGTRFGVRPFGVEAQRLLRLEKGHVIIGQDTDGMTHPAEIDMGWAIGRQKPFFVGQKSIEILESQPLRRKLVGFTLPATASQPLEGHLVLRGDDIAGNVTSCEFSPTLGCIVGLAYAAADQAEPGMSLPIRVEGGEIVQATVARLPFYDPQAQRQEVDA